MEHSVQRVYGAKARMALMVPSTNTVAETEFWEMAPDGITIHTSRMPFFAERCTRPFREKPGGEGWLVSPEQQLLGQFKADSATIHTHG